MSNNREKVDLRREARSEYHDALYERLGVRSKLELRIVEELRSRAIEFGYETEKLKYTTPPQARTYTPDLVFDKPDGSKLYIEIKGYFTPEDRKKHLHIRESNPDLDIRFVFQKPYNPIRKNSKTTYAGWCEKNGFKWAAGNVPKEWLEEITDGEKLRD